MASQQFKATPLTIFEEPMDQKITAAFIAPTASYWKSELGRGLKVASSTTRPASFREGDVVVTALVNGDLNGEVHYVIDENTMMAFYSTLAGKWPKELDDEVADKFLAAARKFAKASTKRLAMQGIEVKIRVVGTIMSKGELMGPASDIGQLEHLYARRADSSDEDHVRVWMHIDGATAENEGGEEGATGILTELELPAPVERSEQPNTGSLDLESELEEPVAEPVAEAEAPPEEAGPTGVIQARRFELIDEKGEVRAVLGALGNGSPHLVLHDATGRMRAAVALSKSGAPRIMLFDEIGERIFEEPPMVAEKSQRKAA